MRKKLLLILGLVMLTVPGWGFDGEFSQMKTDEQEQWGVNGTHEFVIGNMAVGIGGKYFKISDRPAQWNLEARGRFNVLRGLFGEINASTYETHDAVAGGVGYTVHEMLSVSGAYSREYGSSEFDRFLQGQSIDLVRLGANGKTQVRSVALEYGVAYISDYDGNNDRVDGYVRARVDVVRWENARVYLGTGFDRVRFRATQRTYLGVSW